MKRSLVCALGMVLLLAVMVNGADFTVKGVYTAWGQSQHAFNFDKELYDHNYVVQMLRFNITGAANENLKFVTRFDIAQGWWGVDNEMNSAKEYGKTGSSSSFDNKDTHYLVHVDQAYIDFKVPETCIGVRVGRMQYLLGQRLMVDNNYDGVQFDFNKVLGKKITLSWAKVSEGVDDLSDNEKIAADITGSTDARDAHLFTLNFNNEAGAFKYDAFGLYYKDNSISDNNAFIPDLFQYSKSRFSAQVTQLTALGLSFSYKTGKLLVAGEADYLMGKDDIANKKHGAAQNWDINDGDLSGFNLYFKADYTATPKVTVGAVAGLGSGDKDVSGGKGNVNKLRTAGFFYITEIWEDSIMPDEEGITPQGLGAPNVRGYRELENTTIVQINTTFKPLEKVTGFLSYNYIRATQPVHAWASNGDGDWTVSPTLSSQNLGQEVDFRLGYSMYKELNLMLRGGYFMPGTAAQYLITGKDVKKDNAWELKAEVTYSF